MRSGVRAARGAIVATLDGDGQNNPAFLPDLIAAVENGGGRVGLAAGQRVGRKDTGFAMAVGIANGVRNGILNDGTRDTGCGLKAFPREVFLSMPYFDGCIGSCRRWCAAKVLTSPMSMSSIVRVIPACPITVSSTGSGSGSWISPACGG